MQNFLRFFCKKMKMINACTHILYIINLSKRHIDSVSRTDIAIPDSGRMSCSARHRDRSNAYRANSSTR